MHIIKFTQIKLLWVLFFVMYGSLLGMEKHDFEFDRNRDLAIRKVIIPHCYKDNHVTQRTFAVLNKAYNQFIEDTYRPIKKCIEKSDWYQSVYEDDNKHIVSWNEDFSKGAWVFTGESYAGKKYLTLYLCSLQDNNVRCAWQSWDKFKFPIFEDNIRPFFNKEGRACFYGYGKIRTGSFYYPLDDCNRAIQYTFRSGLLEYSIDSDHNKKCCFGVYRLHYRENNRFFAALLNFPVLLQALLHPTFVAKYRESNGVTTNVYDLTRTFLPENYKTFKQHVAWQQSKKCDYNRNKHIISYESLSSDIREAIDCRYMEQQEDKNNKILEKK